MASSKKISDLFRLTQLSDDDEFVVVDKSTTGQAPETGLGGRTTKVTFKDLKESVGTSGPQGPIGPAGPVGPIGETGPVGPQGPRGVSGDAITGPVGPEGPIGPRGEAGPVGPVGPRGIMGPVGPAGQAADRGPKGDTGARGDRGPQGLQGPQGAKGDTGATGPMGRVGPVGPAGKQGPMGPRGATGAKGDKGDKGPPGTTGGVGPRGPAGQAAARGAPGPQGPRGLTGPSGPQGPKGDRGPRGPGGTGPRGLVGPSGPQGPKGNTGSTGARGSIPTHQWSGTSLRFLQSNGSWAGYVNLKGAKGDRGPAGTFSSSQTSNISFSSGIKAISNSGYSSNVRNYGGPTGSWPGLFDGYQLAFQIRTTTGRPGIGKGVQSADWGVDGNGFARVRGNGAGVGLLDGRVDVSNFYDQEIARFQDVGIICRRHVIIQNKQNTERTLSLRPARIRIAGHGGTAANFEGGQLELCHPYNIDKAQEKFVYIDNYYDYNGIYRKNIKQAYLRLGHKGSQAFMVAANHQHQIDGHITLYDGNNAACFFHGKPGGHGSNAYNDLLFRHYPTYNTYQDQAAIRKNGDFECRGTFRANRNWRSASDIRRKKDITPMNTNESLDKVLELNPVRFNWKINPEKHLQMGLIAQEVEKILPSIIDESVDMDTAYDINSPEADPTVEDKSPKDLEVKTKCISYNELIPLLISAMQEQQKQIDDLKKQIASK